MNEYGIWNMAYGAMRLLIEHLILVQVVESGQQTFFQWFGSLLLLHAHQLLNCCKEKVDSEQQPGQNFEHHLTASQNSHTDLTLKQLSYRSYAMPCISDKSDLPTMITIIHYQTIISSYTVTQGSGIANVAK